MSKISEHLIEKTNSVFEVFEDLENTEENFIIVQEIIIEVGNLNINELVLNTIRKNLIYFKF